MDGDALHLLSRKEAAPYTISSSARQDQPASSRQEKTLRGSPTDRFRVNELPRDNSRQIDRDRTRNRRSNRRSYFLSGGVLLPHRDVAEVDVRPFGTAAARPLSVVGAVNSSLQGGATGQHRTRGDAVFCAAPRDAPRLMSGSGTNAKSAPVRRTSADLSSLSSLVAEAQSPTPEGSGAVLNRYGAIFAMHLLYQLAYGKNFRHGRN